MPRKNHVSQYALDNFSLPAEARLELSAQLERQYRARLRSQQRKAKASAAKLQERAGHSNAPPPWPPRSCDTDRWTFVEAFRESEADALAMAGHRTSDRDERDRNALALRRMRQNGAWRHAALLPNDWRDRLCDLEDTFPNFREVISAVRRDFLLAERRTNKRPIMSIRPTLLVGAPGTGKTMFAEHLAAAFELPIQRLDMASAQTSSRLAGSEEILEQL